MNVGADEPWTWQHRPASLAAAAEAQGHHAEFALVLGHAYAESGREVYDGQGGIVLSHQGSDGSELRVEP
jgi:hypothetical protein